MRYDEYKDSGVEWIGEVPRHWKVMPLKRHGRLGKGLSFSKADLVDEGAPAISYGQVHAKYNSNTRITDDLIRFIPKELTYGGGNALVHQGDFIFADTSEDLDGCGNCAYIDKEDSIYGGYHTILYKTRQFDNKFLAYLFKTDCWRSQLRSRVSGVKVFSITQGIMSQASIILPPSSEQRAIASYLDTECGKIDAMIATQTKRIELLQELKQSIITSAVTRGLNPNVELKDSGVEWIGQVPKLWEVSPIKRYCKIQTGTTPPTANDSYYDSDDLNWFTPGDIDDNSIIELRNSAKKISHKAKEDRVCRLFPANTIYFVGIGSIGKVSYCEDIASCNQQINAITPDKRFLNHKFLTYCLKSQQDEIHLSANLVTLPIVNQQRTGMLQIPVPSIDEQITIVEHVDKECARIDALISAQLKRTELLQELKQSLITEVVTGKRKVS